MTAVAVVLTAACNMRCCLFLAAGLSSALAFVPNQSQASSPLKSTLLLATDETNDEDASFELPAETRELIDKMMERGSQNGAFAGSLPSTPNPFGSRLESARKSLYSDDELINVLSLHEQLSDETIDMPESSIDEEDIPSLHEMVTNAIGESSSLSVGLSNANGLTTVGFDLDEEDRARIRKIRAIASDVDGTLLSSRQTLHPRTRMAVKRALQLAKENESFHFFPATGKTRKGALDSLGIEIGTLIATENVPGVYIQGLYCVDGQGNVLFERKLTPEATGAAEKLAKESGISIVAYDGDDLYSTEITDIVRHLHEHYGEPMATLLPGSSEGNVRDLSTHEPLMHKLLLMDDDVELLAKTVRPKLEALAEEYDACVTMALPTMLEWLPKGCSKALGVAKVCDALSIDMETELLAIGDAENDAEMLQQSAIGVAMGNGCPAAKAAANYVLEDKNDDGGAGTAMEIFGFAGR